MGDRVAQFQDQVIFITGGASGIGRALALALGARGARLILADIDVAGLKSTSGAIAAEGGQSRWIELDVADPDQVQVAIDGVYAQEGPIDYLFNNAGICLFGEAYDMTPDQWKRILDVNIRGVVHGISAVYPRMVERGAGHIINTASMVGLVPAAGSAAYCMTKHAVVGVSTSLRGEGAAHGVKVTVVCPGVIDTPLKNTAQMLHLDRQKMLSHPLTRLASVEHCARVIVRGVERNRAIVTVTGAARISWWLYRLFPGFVTSWLGHWAIQAVRKHFVTKAETGPALTAPAPSRASEDRREPNDTGVL
jgi:NAD(P)-dependent dehydrogenase (short-subunit alcohol dehydrogenase family)